MFRGKTITLAAFLAFSVSISAPAKGAESPEAAIDNIRNNTLIPRIEDIWSLVEGRQDNSQDNSQALDSSIIWFGDSRVVGMGMSARANTDTYIGKVSSGYNWMAGEGMRLLMDAVSTNPESQIVFCFGVNDFGNVDSYIQYFKSFHNSYPNSWFETVNPVGDAAAASCGYMVRDNMVQTFNSRLKAEIPDRCLDTYDVLVSTGFGSGDGVHYDAATYAKIEDETRQLIQEVGKEGI